MTLICSFQHLQARNHNHIIGLASRFAEWHSEALCTNKEVFVVFVMFCKAIEFRHVFCIDCETPIRRPLHLPMALRFRSRTVFVYAVLAHKQGPGGQGGGTGGRGHCASTPCFDKL